MDQLRGVLDIQLLLDMGLVGFDGFAAQPQFFSNFMGRQRCGLALMTFMVD